MKKLRSILAVGALLVCQVMFVNAQTTIFTEDFESGTSDWTVVNGTETNQWYNGTATFAGTSGSSMYISNDNGVSNAYTITSASVVHFYRDVNFPTESNLAGYHLSFDWKGMGELTVDYLRVFVVDVNTTPLAGTILEIDNVVGTFNMFMTWQKADIVFPASYAGKTKRLVFSWRNDGSSGAQTPIAVDNIVLKTLPLVHKSLTTVTAGNLGNSLTQTEIDNTTSLALEGTIDARDFKFMRDSMPVLVRLDLTNANIAAYTGTGGTRSGSNEYAAKTIPPYSFSTYSVKKAKTSLHTLLFPDNTENIGVYALADCHNLTTISALHNVDTIGNYAFSYCTKLTQVQLPAVDMDYIGGNAFQYCLQLSSLVELPYNLKYLGATAFYSCKSLESINVHNDVDAIGVYTFARCTGLTSLSLPATLKYIRSNAFENDSNLAVIKIKAVVPPEIANANAFTNVKRNIPVHIPCGTLSAYQDSAIWNTFTNFIETPFELTVLSAAPTMGTATITTPNTCADNTAVIEATPNAGYRFVQWADGDATTLRTVTVTSDTTFTATFEAIPTYVITVTTPDPTKGTVTGGGTFDEGTTITIVATPNAGFRFVQWQEDNNTDSSRTVTVTANATFTAEFETETGIVETLHATSPQVYPNPTRDNITISLPDNATSAVFAVYDLQGRLLLQQTLNSNKETISIVGLSVGVYTYSVVAEGQTYNGRLNIVK